MTEYFRLLAGFTSLSSKRCRSHFCWMGPEGIREFKSIASPKASKFTLSSSQRSEADRQRHQTKTSRDQHGDHDRHRPMPQVTCGRGRSQSVHRAPGSMVEMQAQCDHRDYVEESYPPESEAADHVAVDIPGD